MKIVLWVLAGMVIASNIPPISIFLSWNDRNCGFSNAAGSFTYDEMNFKGRDFDACYSKFVEFKKVNARDTVLYRICAKNYFQFWRYGDYLFLKKYHLPFMDWKNIEKRRGVLTNKSGFQDF